MRRTRVVLDTNILVSAFLNSKGHERHVLDLALAGKLQMVVSRAVLAEYEGVLRRPKFGLRREQVTRLLRLVRAASRSVAPLHELRVARHPVDNRFVECAAAAKAEYLVTGNGRHFPKHWKQTIVLNAREFLEWVIPDLRR